MKNNSLTTCLFLAVALTLTACEGRRSLDNPENLDNMPPSMERAEDTADLHNVSGDAATSPSTTGTTQVLTN